MLRKIRIIFAAVVFIGVTLLFLDFTGTMSHYFRWMAKIQLFPAILAMNLVVIIALAVITLLLGRIYCSVICPMGVMQDIISWISGRRKKMRHRFTYSKEKRILRYGVFVLFAIAFFAGISAFVSILEPYSSYGRVASSLFAPIYGWINNILAFVSEKADSYAFYGVDVVIKGLSAFIVAAVTFVIVAILAWRNGRTYCNTICPVGTLLSFFARFSLFRPIIDKEKCIKCGACTRSCKAACIDFKNQKIDYSRCVTCMDCLQSCNSDALHYSLSRSKKAEEKPETAPANEGRRNFLFVGAAFAAAATLKAQEKKVDGGLAVIEDKKVPERSARILPPGAIAADKFAKTCTACQLCIAECPNGVLSPSQDLEHFMQPSLSFEKGSCTPNCNNCSKVCPTGAILPISHAEKSAIQIGVAVWEKKNCIVNTKHVKCGLCARRCPTGAITMVPIKDSEGNDTELAFPMVNKARCIGCGACEYHCPSRPFPAIYVNGFDNHRHI